MKIQKNIVLAKEDRGLLPSKERDKRQENLYNQSHRHLGPGHYGKELDKFTKSTMRQEGRTKIGISKRHIDLTKWRAENTVLISKGLGL
jgi:hypothetical protein